MSAQELADLAVSMGAPGYRGKQIFSWLHKKRVHDPTAMTNLPEAFRRGLAELGPIMPVEAGVVLESRDGTRKIEVVLQDGARVETVLIPEEGKLTQCVSSQVGCAVGCVFCRSGTEGLKRNLTAAEIVGQLHLARASYFEGERLGNVVLMGVGEPMHNLDGVLRALEIMSSPDGLDLSTRRVTLSTVGIPRGIERLAEATGGKTALAVSLHAANDDVRRRLVPGVSASLADIIEALGRYPLPKRRRFTIEYVIGGRGERSGLGRPRPGAAPVEPPGEGEPPASQPPRPDRSHAPVRGAG